MWVCPKCGREFKNQNQSHYCGKAPMTIDQYIDAQSEESQPYLLEVRKAIHEATSFILPQLKSILVYMQEKKQLLNLLKC